MSHTRVAVVQIDFHPAALVDRHSPLEDPLFELNAPSSLLPASGLVPAELIEPFEQLRARVRREHNRCLMLKLRAVLERCRAWGVKLVLLPEYSVAAELLPELAEIAPELVVVAGTHAVERARQREGIYAQLGWPDAPRSGMAVAPVLHAGRLLALQPKLSANKYERGNLVCGDRWAPIEFDLGGGPAIPGPLGVMICLDFLFRERPEHRELVGPGLDRVRFLAVPSYTPWHSAGEFAAEAWQEARRYGRPVLWANVASDGGSSIFIDEGQIGELQNYPRRVGLLERGDEGVIVADVDLGYRRVGDSTRYGGESIVKPVAIASLVYRHHPIGDRYAAWVEDFERRLDKISEDEAAELVEGARALLLEAASLPGGHARARRLRRLLAEVQRINVNEEFRQFTREVVLPGGALPLGVLRQVWARECAELVFEWTRAHRGAGLEEIEQRLRAGGKLEVEAELWTETGRDALRETAAAIRAEVVEAQSDAPQVGVRVPISMPLVQLDLEGEGLQLVFRATPGELRGPDHWIRFRAGSRVGEPISRPRWPSPQFDRARSLWLLERARGHLDASVVGVDAGEHNSSVLVCVREGDRRVLLAADWGPLAEWLHERVDAFLRVTASCCDELRFVSLDEYHAAVAALWERFEGARAVIDRAVEFRLRELNRASTKILARVDDGDTSQVALDVLEAWLGRPEQVMLVSGGFGTGKSTLLAQWCQQRWQLGDHGGVIRCPILVDLATSEQREPIDALLLAAGRDPASLPDRAALSLLLSEGELIACFDGFDEMVTRLGFREVPERLAALLEVANEGGKVLVASRDSYFSSADAIARDMQQAQTRSRTRGHVHLHLQPFGAAQVDDVIRQFIEDAARQAQVREKIRSTYALEDLVQTPMLLSMVLQTIDEIDPGARVGSANVYERYLDRVLAQADVGDPELFSPEQKRAFAEVLAAELWRSGETSLNWTQLHKSVMATVYDILPTAPPEAALLEIQNGTFFVCEGEDRFRFAHKSFLEFFVAKGLLAGLERNPEQVLDTARLTPEVAAFVAELLRVRGTDKDDPAVQSLQRWLVGGREGRLEASARAAANALRLLRDVAREFEQPAGWVPKQADLRWVVFDGEELVGLSLHGARLGRARMIGVEFGDADLHGSSIQDADLRDARFRGARLDAVVVERTDLSGVEAHGCSLRGASFRKVEMRQATGTGCDWQAVMVEELRVGPTILTNLDELDPDAGGLRTPMLGSRLALGSGHSDTVTSVAWSPDGRRIASASCDHSIRIWDSDDGRNLSTLSGHSQMVTSVAWSPDGRRIASASSDDSIRIWDAHDGRNIATLSGHSFGVTSVAWSPDGRRIASACHDDSIRIWDSDDGRNLSTLPNPSLRSMVAWSPDGRRIASTSGGSILIWDSNDGRNLVTVTSHSDYNRVAWSPDGRRIASLSDGSILIWDADDGRNLSTLAGHANVVAWSPDGHRIASALDSIRIWDAHDGRNLTNLAGHIRGVTSLAWSPDGCRIASASYDSSIRIWDSEGGHNRSALSGHSHWVTCVAWSPNGCLIASASDDSSIRVWDAEDGRNIATLSGHSSGVTSVAWSPDGRRIASASDDSSIRIWDAEDGRNPSTLSGHSNPVTFVAWSPDGRRIASASSDDSIRIWDAEDGSNLSTLSSHSNTVTCVTWSPDGHRIACNFEDHSIRILDSDDGRNLATLSGHSRVTFVAWSPDGRRIASASRDHSVGIWEVEDGTLATLLGHSSAVTCVAWSLDGRRIASASHDNSIRIWASDDGRNLSTLSGHSKGVTSVAWSPDGRRIASASQDNTVRIWHVAPATEILPDTEKTLCVAYSPDGTNFTSGADDRSLCIFDSRSLARTVSTHDHRSSVLALAYAPNGEHLASASSDCRIRIFDAKTLTRIHVLAGHTRDATNLAYSPDGKLLASSSGDRTIRLWNPATGEALAATNHDDWANCVAFSPDGTKIASGSSDHRVYVWSVPNLDKLLEVDAHAHYVNGIAWYPDGERLVSSSWDKTLRIWDANSGRRIHELVGHEAPIRGLAFAPDGTRFASVSDDKSLRIWDAETYKQLEVFHSQTGLRRVAWSPDSAQIIAGSQAGVQIWRIESCLAILQAHGDTSLVQTPSGQFYLQPESAEAYLEVPRPDRSAVFYLPLAGIRTHQSRESVAHALAGRPTRSLAQTLGWAPVGWDGEVHTIPLERNRSRPQLVTAPTLDIATNPFSPDTALRNTSTLPGRRVEIDKVVQVLRRRGVVWLRGPRRAGKTSLLAFLEGHLAGHRVFTRSLQAGKVKTPDDIAILLVPDLRESTSPADAFWDRLAKVESPVIMLDEIAVMVEAEPQTLRWLRALGQERASLIYSGSHYDWVQVKRRMREVPGSSFGNDVTFVDFGPIPEPDALDFLKTTAPPWAPISEELARWVVDECGTWPFYLQVLGYALVEAQTLHRGTPSAMSREDFREFYRHVLLEGKDNYFDTRWREFTARARAILREALDHDNRGSLPDSADLTIVEKRVLRDEGALTRDSWALDKPFLDWMRENRDMLEEEVT